MSNTSFPILKKYLRKLLILITALVVLLCFWHCNSLMYGLRQGAGQLKIIIKAQPIEEILADDNFPDSLKEKLHLIQEIRNFAIDSLGINDSRNYTTFYNQHGQPVLWVVIASPPYQVQAYEWKFPIVGSFSYKGYFKEAGAEKEAARLQKDGYDTRIGTVGAWSTLGYFRDPVLSNMLERSEGNLAALIIHELTHATVYVKDNVQFNENLATFIGNEGAKLFLIHRYGENSRQYQEYLGNKSDKRKFTDHLLRGANALDSLYATFSSTMPPENKDSLKYAKIRKIMALADTISYYDPTAFSNLRRDDFVPNNAFFVSFRMYHNDLSQFREVFESQFDSDFIAFLNYLKTTYRSL